MIAAVSFQAGNASSAPPGPRVDQQASRPLPLISASIRRSDCLPSFTQVASAPRRIPTPDPDSFLPMRGPAITHREAAAAQAAETAIQR